MSQNLNMGDFDIYYNFIIILKLSSACLCIFIWGLYFISTVYNDGGKRKLIYNVNLHIYFEVFLVFEIIWINYINFWYIYIRLQCKLIFFFDRDWWIYILSTKYIRQILEGLVFRIKLLFSDLWKLNILSKISHGNWAIFMYPFILFLFFHRLEPIFKFRNIFR